MKTKTVPYFLKDNGSFAGTKFPVYKLFVYTNEWVFNNDEFTFLEHDSKYFYNTESILLISFIETNSYRSFEILKNMYSNQLDNFELKSDEICVFGVCSKDLEELRFENKILNKDKQYSKISVLQKTEAHLYRSWKIQYNYGFYQILFSPCIQYSLVLQKSMVLGLYFNKFFFDLQ